MSDKVENQMSAGERMRKALEEIRETVKKRQLPITNEVWELADAALASSRAPEAEQLSREDFERKFPELAKFWQTYPAPLTIPPTEWLQFISDALAHSEGVDGWVLTKLADEIEHTIFYREIDVLEEDIVRLKRQIANLIRSKALAAPAPPKESTR